MAEPTTERPSLTLAAHVAAWVLTHPTATVADVMAEFDLSDAEAIAALTTARHIITSMTSMVPTEWESTDE